MRLTSICKKLQQEAGIGCFQNREPVTLSFHFNERAGVIIHTKVKMEKFSCPHQFLKHRKAEVRNQWISLPSPRRRCFHLVIGTGALVTFRQLLKVSKINHHAAALKMRMLIFFPPIYDIFQIICILKV